MPTQVLIAIGAASIALPCWRGRCSRVPRGPSRRGGQPAARAATGARADQCDVTGQRRRPLVLRVIPAGGVARIDRLAARAGRPAAWPMERLLTAKLVLAVVAAVLGLLYITMTGSLLVAGGGRGSWSVRTSCRSCCSTTQRRNATR